MNYVTCCCSKKNDSFIWQAIRSVRFCDEFCLRIMYCRLYQVVQSLKKIGKVWGN